MLNNIRVVLVNTFHPGNIGASLRAMKTMGLKELFLVAPVSFPHDDVFSMAAGADDLIEHVNVVSSLEEAIADCTLVIGTSARTRGDSWPLLSPKECAEKLLNPDENNRSALVFGRERSGLTNHEIQMCDYHVMIPANPDYPVLNLSQAVQILGYEIWKRLSDQHEKTSETTHRKSKQPYPVRKDMEHFYQSLEKTLFDINFIIKQHPGEIMIRLRRLFNRARLDVNELNILRGILARINQNASGESKQRD